MDTSLIFNGHYERVELVLKFVTCLNNELQPK